MIKKTAAAIMTGPMASPSSPSVKFTAFEAPTITKTPKARKNQLKSINKLLKKGTAREVANSGLIRLIIQRVEAVAIRACKSSFNFPGNPLLLRRETFM